MKDSEWQSSIIYQLQMTSAQKALFLTASTTVSLSNIAVNAFLVHALRRLKKLNTASFLFILALSISDICVGIVQLAVQVTPLLMHPKRSDPTTLCAQFFIYFVNQVSGGMIIIITADRYIHMKYLVKYNMHMTKTKAKLLVAANFGISFGTTMLLTLSTMYGFYFEYKIILVPCYVVGLVAVFVIYFKTYISISTRIKALRLEQNIQPARARRASKADNDFARGMVYVLAFLVVCYLPSILLALVRSILSKAKRESVPVQHALLWSYTVAYINSSGNAMIFIANNKQLKRYALSFIKQPAASGEATQVNLPSANKPTNSQIITQ